MQRASGGARVGAFFLDGLFLFLIGFVVGLIPVLGWFLAPFVSFLYFALTEGSPMSASLGKKICGLMVVDEYGRKLTMGKGFLRSLCKMVTNLTLGIGYILGLCDDQGLAMHDRMSGTRVINDPTAHNSAPVVPAAPVYNAPQPQYQQPQYQPQYQPQQPVGGNPTLVCTAGALAGQAFRIAPNGCIIGRDSTMASVVISEANISRTHCKVTYQPANRTFLVQDLGSTHGTFLRSGIRLAPNSPKMLNPGEEFCVASPNLCFRVSL